MHLQSKGSIWCGVVWPGDIYMSSADESSLISFELTDPHKCLTQRVRSVPTLSWRVIRWVQAEQTIWTRNFQSVFCLTKCVQFANVLLFRELDHQRAVVWTGSVMGYFCLPWNRGTHSQRGMFTGIKRESVFSELMPVQGVPSAQKQSWVSAAPSSQPHSESIWQSPEQNFRLILWSYRGSIKRMGFFILFLDVPTWSCHIISKLMSRGL